MKYTVDGTRYTTIREGAQVEVKADDVMEVQKQGYDVQILVGAIPAVRLSTDGESVWCSTEHLVGGGL